MLPFYCVHFGFDNNTLLRLGGGIRSEWWHIQRGALLLLSPKESSFCEAQILPTWLTIPELILQTQRQDAKRGRSESSLLVCFTLPCSSTRFHALVSSSRCQHVPTSRGQCRTIMWQTTPFSVRVCFCRVARGGLAGDSSPCHHRAGRPHFNWTNEGNSRSLQLLLHGCCPLQVRRIRFGFSLKLQIIPDSLSSCKMDTIV